MTGNKTTNNLNTTKPKVQKRKRCNNDPSSEDEDEYNNAHESTNENDNSSQKPPKKKAKPNLSPEEKDAAWVADKGFDGLSNEEILENQKKGWKAPCYDHYHPAEITTVRNVVKYKFVCKRNPSESVTRVRSDNSTGNLDRHVERCSPERAKDQEAITTYTGAYDKGRMRLETVYWVTTCYRPYSIVMDPPLARMLHAANPNVKLVVDTTVSDDVIEVHRLTIPYVIILLNAYPGFLHLSFDGWSARNVLSFLGITVHFVRDGKLACFILDFVELCQSHTGQYLAEEIVKVLKTFGIEKKIFGLVGDNASNNDKMIAKLQRKLCDCPAGPSTRVQCACHVFNLTVGAILMSFKTIKKIGRVTVEVDEEEGEADEEAASDEELEEDEEEDEEDFGLLGDIRDQEDADFLEKLSIGPEEMRKIAGDRGITDYDWEKARRALRKASKLSKRIHYSKTLRVALQEYCEKKSIKYLTIKRPVATRWNTHAVMLQSMLRMQAPLDDLTMTHSKLPMITSAEWDILTGLEEVLRPFLTLTKRLENKKRPLLHEVIPALDIATQYLEKMISDPRKLPVIRVAASRGLLVLDKYYSKTDDSIMYRCAMIMHPKYKLSYFKREGWPEIWLTEAKRLIRQLWDEWYKPSNKAELVVSENTVDPDDMFASLDAPLQMTMASDALEEWMMSSILNCEDPIEWWTNQLESKASTVNPALARMALDLLSCPAASSEMERGFSRGGLMVSSRRHNLKGASVRAGIVLSSWAEVPGLIPEDNIVKNFNAKVFRKKWKALEDVIDVD